MNIIGTNWEEELVRRAMAAWFRSGGTDQPSNASGIIEHDGKLYVRLLRVQDVMAVYRVRIVNEKPVLKALSRWPVNIGEQAQQGKRWTDVDLFNLLPKSSKLLALERALTAEELQEINDEIAEVQAVAKEIKKQAAQLAAVAKWVRHPPSLKGDRPKA